MKKMLNSIQHYTWGSHTAMSELYGINNPENLPMAELWMGAHPLCSSEVTIDNKNIPLNRLISQNKSAYLGDKVAQRFGELPFLFKVLCAGQPLSIQVHPSKKAAEAGYAKEESAKIPLNAANRNYKDPNHKPELVFALTPFLAMNGFRPLDEIASLLTPLKEANPQINAFIKNPTEDELSKLFATLLMLKECEQQKALNTLQQQCKMQKGQPWDAIRYIAQFYPHDNGLFAPLLLNVVELKPGEAMFLYAETPHAYLQGSALEVMANSDNVLRAGLTGKYIDIKELLANLAFKSQPASALLMQPIAESDTLNYPIPVDDFAFSLHQINHTPQLLAQESAAIIFCLKGKITLTKDAEKIELAPGESCFISASESPISANGKGEIARVYNRF